MLKIIMGSEYADKYIKDKKFIEFPSKSFNTFKKREWFSDEFVREVIKEIDKAYVESDFAVHSIEYDLGYSVNDLAGGSKFLILAYCLRENVYLATMGDNCTDFLERISLDYEREGKDLLIVSNYLHLFQFNYIHSIEYVNWDITCHSLDDIQHKINHRWLEQEGYFERRRKHYEEDDVSEEELTAMEELLSKN